MCTMSSSEDNLNDLSNKSDNEVIKNEFSVDITEVSLEIVKKELNNSDLEYNSYDSNNSNDFLNKFVNNFNEDVKTETKPDIVKKEISNLVSESHVYDNNNSDNVFVQLETDYFNEDVKGVSQRNSQLVTCRNCIKMEKQLDETIKKYGLLQTENDKLKRKVRLLDNRKNDLEQKVNELSTNLAKKRRKLETPVSTLDLYKMLTNIQKDISELPEKLLINSSRDHSARNNCFLSQNNYSVPLEEEYRDLVVSDDEIYIGCGETVKKCEITKIEYNEGSLGGRMKQLVLLFWGDKAKKYVLSHSGRKDVKNNLMKAPATHVKIITDLLLDMKWPKDEIINKSKIRNTLCSVLYELRRRLYDKNNKIKNKIIIVEEPVEADGEDFVDDAVFD